jgi:phosphopentomutase
VRARRAGRRGTLDLLRTVNGGFIFTNLNGFDSKFGHRRDARGYAAAFAGR